MVIYIPFIYLTIWNFKGCSRSVVTYWLGLSIDFWKFLGELLSSNLTSTRFILKSQQRKCMVFKCPWGNRFPLHHCTAIYYCLNQCVAPCIPASTLGHTDLTSEQNHFVQWETGPLQSSGPLSPYPIRKKKFIWQRDNLQHNSSWKSGWQAAYLSCHQGALNVNCSINSCMTGRQTSKGQSCRREDPCA